MQSILNSISSSEIRISVPWGLQRERFSIKKNRTGVILKMTLKCKGWSWSEPKTKIWQVVENNGVRLKKLKKKGGPRKRKKEENFTGSSRVQLLCNPTDCRLPPGSHMGMGSYRSTGFSKQECWSGWLLPSPGDLPNSGTEPITKKYDIHSQKCKVSNLEQIHFPCKIGSMCKMRLCYRKGMFPRSNTHGIPEMELWASLLRSPCQAVPFKKQKRANEGSSGAQKVLCAKDSGGSQNESLGSNEADLAKKKSPNPSGDTGNSENQDSMAAQNVYRKSQMSGYTCTTPAKSNLDSGEPETSVLEGSGPFRLKNYLTSGKNNSDVDDNVVQENLNDSREEISNSPPESKMHHKLVLPSNTPNVRRTVRTRSKPLEYWRGERINYQGRPSGGFVIGGILSPDTVSSKRKAKGNLGRVITTANRKRICLENDERKNKFMVNLNIPLGDPLQPTRVKDPETRETVLMDLIRPRDTYQFCVEHDELKVYKTLDTPFFSTGKLILGPNQEKGKQHVGLDTLVFYVNLGHLLCTLHETPYIITTGDSFYVPSGNYYNIKNLLNEESVLLFTQIKS
ncbi:hypothetical protein FD755_001498 [Muntiacus reevesi]|uniref:Centromere protein C n=1 Tax=Muntiacus reevesi TaxID=9886 RepID=A0A5J5N2R6_MUNRE|nr:hypothetical protein FD755_001498 [Muntiacus reevesi]